MPQSEGYLEWLNQQISDIENHLTQLESGQEKIASRQGDQPEWVDITQDIVKEKKKALSIYNAMLGSRTKDGAGE